jgi:ssDNA-binding Zn-finger/Zn-ribbon topoisomerase 1
MKILQGKSIWLKWLIGFGFFIIIATIHGLVFVGLFKLPPKITNVTVPLVMWGFPIIFYLMAREHTIYEVIKKMINDYKKRKATSIMQVRCPNCKYEGNGKYIVKGSTFIEFILWCCFVIPGLIYSVWRLNNKKWICPQCDFEHVVKYKIG